MKNEPNRFHPFKEELMSNESILAIMKEEFDFIAASKTVRVIPYLYMQVDNLSPTTVSHSIALIIMKAVNSEPLSFSVLSHSSENKVFNEHLNYFFLKNKRFGRYTHRHTSAKKKLIIMCVLGIIYDLLKTRIDMTLRDVFYHDVNIYEEQVIF